jgi:hypothetical protein
MSLIANTRGRDKLVPPIDAPSFIELGIWGFIRHSTFGIGPSKPPACKSGGLVFIPGSQRVF